MAAKRAPAKRQSRPRTPLRAVEPNEAPPEPAKPKSITEAVAAGTELEQNLALQALIARKLEDPGCPARDMASLSKRLMEVGKDIAAIRAAQAEEAGGAASTPDDDWQAV